MTQSAGHIEAGPNACPFVALQNDRDARAPTPDERHRCYAESVPAPRTIAHQERFCLSPHFADCPIFAEWAVRAAARPVPGTGTSTAAVAGAGTVAEASTAAAAGPGAPEAAPELWFERIDKTVEPRRDERWPDSMDAAPPAAAALAAQVASARDEQQLAAFEAPRAGRDEPPGTSSMPAAPDEEDRGFDPAPLPTFLTERSPRARTSVPPPVSDEHVATIAEPDVRRSAARRDDDNGDGPFTRLLTMAAVLIILALGVATVLIVPGLLAGNPGQAPPSLVAGASRPPPTALASVVAGVPTTSPVEATVAPEPEPSTPAPAATPTPTPRSYKIQPGDRLRQIAREFGVTVERILAANPEIADPNDIQVGQRIVIPAP